MTREDIFHLIDNDGPERSKWGTIYDSLMLAMIIISIVPLTFRDQDTLLLHWFDKVSVTAFIIDYLLRWCTVDIKMGRKGKWGAMAAYPITPSAIVDLLSILPSLGVFHKAFKMFRMVRLMKILRVARLIRYSKHVQLLFGAIRRQRKVLLTVLVFALGYILVTALLMFNVEMGVHEDGKVMFDSFFDAIYWATVSLTTVGYGDIYPVTALGRVVSILSSIFGVAVIALPSGVITASYLDELGEWKEQEKKRNDDVDDNVKR